MVWILWSVMFFIFGVVQYRHAIFHAQMYEYKPILGDVWYWFSASLFMALMSILMNFILE